MIEIGWERLTSTTRFHEEHIVKNTKRARLEARGWRVGSATNFLDLTSEEASVVETKLTLSQSRRNRRRASDRQFKAREKGGTLTVAPLRRPTMWRRH